MTRRVLLIAVGTVIGLAAVVSVASGADWRTVAARKIIDGEIVDIELWSRGAETRYRESRAGTTEYEIQCEDSTLVSRSATLGNVVVRELASAAACREQAAAPLLGISELAKSARFERVPGEDGRTRYAEVGDKHGDIIELDAITGLPLSLTNDDEVAVRWEYVAPDSSQEAPDPIAVPATGVEKYQELSRVAVSAWASGIEVPDRIGEFSWETSFLYTSERGGLRAYTIWANPTGENVQLVVGPRPVGSVASGTEDQGSVIVLNLVEERRLVQVFAPDLAMATEAARALGLDAAVQ